MFDVWEKMEVLYQEGKAHALGGGSHGPELIAALTKRAKIQPPAVMYEKWDVFHRGSNEQLIRNIQRKYGVWVVATGPIHGTPFELSCFLDPIVQSVARRLGRSSAQVCLRFCLQNGLGAIPKSRRQKRLVENAAIFDFEIPDAEMQILNGLAHALRLPSRANEMLSLDTLGYLTVEEGNLNSEQHTRTKREEL